MAQQSENRDQICGVNLSHGQKARRIREICGLAPGESTRQGAGDFATEDSATINQGESR
jgi:hypothetical protein